MCVCWFWVVNDALTPPVTLTLDTMVVVSVCSNFCCSHWSTVPPVSYFDEASTIVDWPGRFLTLFLLVVSVNSVDPVLNLSSGVGKLYGFSTKKVPMIPPKTSVISLTLPFTNALALLSLPTILEFFFI